MVGSEGEPPKRLRRKPLTAERPNFFSCRGFYQHFKGGRNAKQTREIVYRDGVREKKVMRILPS